VNHTVIPLDAWPEIARRYTVEGHTQKAIADDYKVTKQRIQQGLLVRGITAEQSPRTHKFRKAKADRTEAQLARYMPGVRCTRREYLAITQAEPKAALAWRRFLRNADARKVAVELTFPEWWNMWQESGRWAERGVGNGYGMFRPDSAQPYKVGNIEIKSGAEQASQIWVRRRASQEAACSL
jgi:hypothetical protein